MEPVTVQVVVEKPDPGMRVLRVAGRLEPRSAARVLRLLDILLGPAGSGPGDTTHVVIDLSGVSSFEPGGLESLRHAPYTAGRRGIGVWFCGCGGRVHLLPGRVRRLLTEFRTFPTLEGATRALAGPATGDHATPARIGPAR